MAPRREGRFEHIGSRSQRRLGELQATETEVEVQEGVVLVALDHLDARHLLVPVASGIDRRPDVGAAVTIRIRTLDEGGLSRRYVDVACNEPRLHDLFETVISEMLDRLTVLPEGDHYRTCQRVLDRWRQLLRRGDARLLGPDELAGLLAELWWLDRLAAVDPGSALRYWTGPEGAPQDFTGSDTVIEVKAVTGRRSVTIHGVLQLRPPADTSLYLATVHLGPSDPRHETTVPQLVDRLTDRGVDTVALLEKLATAGYHDADRDVYATYRWTVEKEEVRSVTGDFPRITPETADFGLHAAVRNVTYGLDLDSCPGEDDLAPDDLARHLLGRKP